MEDTSTGNYKVSRFRGFKGSREKINCRFRGFEGSRVKKLRFQGAEVIIGVKGPRFPGFEGKR